MCRRFESCQARFPNLPQTTTIAHAVRLAVGESRQIDAQELMSKVARVAVSALIARHLPEGGLVGEERNAKLLTLVAVTMYLARPMSVLIGGESSGGKSYLLEQLIKTLPESMVVELQSVSNMGLAYVGRDALKRKFLVLYELGGRGKEGSDPSQFASKHGVSASRIRQLLAEKRIFPYQKSSNGRWILFSNSVIVAPYERPNRKLRGKD